MSGPRSFVWLLDAAQDARNASRVLRRSPGFTAAAVATLALGASRQDILSRTLSRGLVPAAVGLILGLALAVVLARTFRALLFNVEPLDTSSLAAGAILLLGVALAAALGPGLTASRVDPSITLRSE